MEQPAWLHHRQVLPANVIAFYDGITVTVRHSQQVEEGDSAPLLNAGEVPPGVLCSQYRRDKDPLE